VGGVLLHDADRNFFQAGYQAISAFGNCGLHLGTLPDAAGARVQLIILPLSLLGGFGLPVLMEIADRFRGNRPMSVHSRTVLLWSAGAYAALTLVLILLRAPGVSASPAVWQRTIAAASREAINSRSTGFPFESASYLPQTAATVLILAMLVGAAPGGTAGGLKLTTVAALTGGTRDLLARRSAGRPLGIAVLWTGIYLAMVLLATLALMVTDPELHLDRTLFMAVSALGNVGLSHDPIVASDAGLCVMSVVMLLGRVAPVLMLWYLFDTTPEAVLAVG
jgi:trk system potassium uptake protein TrkH